MLWLFYLAYKEKITFLIVLTSLIFLISSYLFLPNSHHIETHNHISDKLIILEGKISSQVYLKDSYLQFNFKQKNAIKLNVKYFYKNNFREVKKAIKKIETGRHCIIKGKNHPPTKKTNPGQFDYGKYLANENIQTEIIVEDIKDIRCDQKSLLTPIWSLRNKILFIMKDNYSDFSSSWLIALILGEDSYITSYIIDHFRYWNIAHLLAISGLHTAIFVGIIYLILMKLLKFTIESTQIILILILPLFTILTGAEPSVVRASLMVIVFILLNLLQIKLKPSDLISIIFIGLVIINPYFLTHIGFQFSFAVTFGLLTSLKWLSQTNSRIIQSFKISFISQMIILPLQLHYFTIFQPLSIILNVIVIPYFTVFVIPYMFLMLIGMFLPRLIREVLDSFFVGVHTIFIDILTYLTHVFSEHFIIGELDIKLILIYYGIFLIFMREVEAKRIKQSVLIGSALIIFILYIDHKEIFSPEGRVTMLDIGQGDAIIIELPYKQGVYMIDAGSHFSFTDMKPSQSIYNQVIKPYLYYRGISKIDGVFLSHDHIDHTGSLQFILNDFKVNEIFISPYHPIKGELLEKIRMNQSFITIINPAENIVRNNLLFQVLHPTKDEQDENDNSLIIYTKIGGKSWLFNGDASAHNELDLLKVYPNLNVDVLKVGHHGSNTSTDNQFLQKIKPDYALVSAGKNNVYGHPTPTVIERLKSNDIKVFRTDQDGAIEYKYNIQSKNASFNKFIK